MALVSLCSPPVMSVVRPSLALGLLKTALGQCGVDVRVVYANLIFAEMIGVELNERLAEDIPTELLAGDWIFARTSVTMDELDEAYLEMLEAQLGRDTFLHLSSDDSGIQGFVAEIARQLVADDPILVGFSSMFQQTAASLAIAKEVKRIAPATITCFGGANCHAEMGEALIRSFDQIDCIFTGEADESFPSLVKRLAETGELAEMPGMLTRAGLERPAPLPDALQQRPAAQPMPSLIPDHEPYFSELRRCSFAAAVSPAVTFEASRGCWWGQKSHCTFCGLNSQGMHFRSKSAEAVIDEIQTLYRAYNIPRFCAVDNIMAIAHVEGVFGDDRIRDAGLKFFYEVKSNLNETSIERLARAGVNWIQPGVESLSDAVLKLMRKGVSTLTNLRLLRLCREYGVSPVWNLLHGFPYEPAESYAEMARLLPLIEHFRPPTGISRIRIDRFSPNFEDSDAIGFDGLRPAPAYRSLYRLPAETLEKLAYFFEGSARGLPEGDYTGELKRAVQDWRQRWFGGGVVPDLKLERIGPVAVLHDTRSCADAEWTMVSDSELKVLGAFRDPGAVATRLGSLPLGRFDAEAAFAKLKSNKWLLCSGDAALSIVDEGRLRVLDAAASFDIPAGSIDFAALDRPSGPPSAGAEMEVFEQ